MRQIEKPEVSTKVIDKKTLWFNIRESRLMYMLHRNLITSSEYEAGSRYRRMCEIATLGSGSSMQDVRIDGANPILSLLNLELSLSLLELAMKLDLVQLAL